MILYQDDKGVYKLGAFGVKIYGKFNTETNIFSVKHGSIFGECQIVVSLQGIDNKTPIHNGAKSTAHVTYWAYNNLPGGASEAITISQDLCPSFHLLKLKAGQFGMIGYVHEKKVILKNKQTKQKQEFNSFDDAWKHLTLVS